MQLQKTQGMPTSRPIPHEIDYIKTTVTTNDNKPDQTYVGLTSNTFKTRFNNHKNTFKYRRKKHSTELSNHVWDLRDNKMENTSKLSLITTPQIVAPQTYVCGKNTL